MTPTQLLESVRRIEVRTDRLVNDTMVGAFARGLTKPHPLLNLPSR